MPAEHPRVLPVRASDLPYNCQHCIIDRNNNTCTYSAWRRAYSANMKIDCVGPIEAMSCVNRAVACMANGKTKTGVIIDFVPKLKKLSMKNVSGNIESIEKYTYPEMCAWNYTPAINISA